MGQIKNTDVRNYWGRVLIVTVILLLCVFLWFQPIVQNSYTAVLVLGSGMRIIGKRIKKRAMGIEPTCPAWKAGALPLSYARICN